MPVRQKHRKSRGGCNSCKTRRIKCDEEGPPCHSCVARGLACQYSQRAQLSRQLDKRCRKPTDNPPWSAAGTLLPVHVNVPQAPGNRLFELRLMNQWTASTYLTFCHQLERTNEQVERRLWQILLPNDFLSHECCLNALFAITSLHLASDEDPTRREAYITAAIHYQNCSLEMFRQILPRVTDSNCQAMYACSLAHFVLRIVLSEMDRTCNPSSSAKNTIVSSLALFGGCKEIMSIFGDRLDSMPIAHAMAPKSMASFSRKNPHFGAAINHLRGLNRERCRWEDEQTFQHVEAAIDQLEASSIRSVNGIEAALTGWLMSLETGFISALERGEVISTLTVMHWATLMRRPSSLWWTFKSGTSLIVELSRSLPTLTEGEQAAKDWCLDQIANEVLDMGESVKFLFNEGESQADLRNRSL